MVPYVVLVNSVNRAAVEAAIARIEGAMLCNPDVYRSSGCNHRPAQLSTRLGRILQLVAQGMTNKEIGRDLGISHNTVRNHLVRLFRMYDVTNRVELAALVNRRTSLSRAEQPRAA